MRKADKLSLDGPPVSLGRLTARAFVNAKPDAGDGYHEPMALWVRADFCAKT